MNELKTLFRNCPCTCLLILANCLCFLLLFLSGDPQDTEFMLSRGASFAPLTLDGEPWRLLTAMFLHFDISHLLNNMLSLFAVGSIVERFFGKARFLLLYFLSGAGAGLISAVCHLKAGQAAVCAGASGAVFGLIGALTGLALFRLTDRCGIRSRRVLPAALLALVCSAAGNTDTAAHIGGVVTGLLTALALILFKKLSRPGSSV